MTGFYKKYFFLGIILATLVFLFVQPLMALAQTVDPLDNLKNTAEKGGLIKTGQEPTSLSKFIGNIIRAVLGFLGVIFFVLIIFGGFSWMTAAGNEEQVGKAKKIITNATIGLVIVVLAYALTSFVLDRLITASQTTPAAEVPTTTP